MKISITIWVILIAAIVVLLTMLNKSQENDAARQETYDSLALVARVHEGHIVILQEWIWNLENEDKELGEEVVVIKKVYIKIKEEILIDTVKYVPMVDVKRLSNAADLIIDQQSNQLDIRAQIITAHELKDVEQDDLIDVKNAYIDYQDDHIDELNKRVRKENRKGKIKALGGIAIGVLIAIL